MTLNFNFKQKIIKKYRKYLDTRIIIKPWQLICLIQRRYKIDRYLKSHEIRKLHLGAGENVIEGWLNSDLIPKDTKVIFLDITQRFPFENGTFDYVYTEHLIEHISMEKGFFVFKECYRVLKPGGVIRVSTPDLHFLIDLFKPEKTEIQKQYIQWAIDTNIHQACMYSEVFVINNFFRSWGHQFIYDFELIKKILENSGFSRVRKSFIGKSEHEILQRLEHHWTIIPEKFNSLETMVVEGEKE